MTTPPPVVPPPSEAPRPRGAGGPATPAISLRRLLTLVAVAAFGWSLPNTAAATLVQALLAQQTPDRKVELAAVVTTVGAVTAMVCTVLAGALSDRTRSRFGRRAPWMVGGAITAAAGLLLAAATGSFGLLVLGYALFQGGLNTLVAALTAVTPDRVPTDRLGGASAVAGLGYLLGLVGGSAVAAAFVTSPERGLVVVPWALVLAAAVFVLGAPDASSRDLTPSPFHPRSLAPPLERDFLLAFAGRFLTLFALLLFTVYGLFVATDHLGLSLAEAGGVIALGTLLLGGAALFSTVAGGVVSDRIGRRKPLVVGSSLLMAAGAIPVLVAPSVATLLTFMALAGVGYGAYLSVDAALMVEVLPARDAGAGKDLGFLTLANTAPVVLAPGIAGAVVSGLGYPALFVALMVCAAVGGVCILLIRRVR